MTLTGHQIGEARALLRLNRSILAQKVGRITTLALLRAEAAESQPLLSAEQDTPVRRTLERLGIGIPARVHRCSPFWLSVRAP